MSERHSYLWLIMAGFMLWTDAAIAQDKAIKNPEKNPAPAIAAKPVSARNVMIRAGQHADHTRVVFDFANNIAFSTSQDNAGVNIEFPTAITVNASQIRPNFFKQLQKFSGSTIKNGKTTVSFAVPNGVRARSFRMGNKIVVDLVQEFQAGKDPGFKKKDEHKTSTKEEQLQAANPVDEGDVKIVDPHQSKTEAKPEVKKAETTPSKNDGQDKEEHHAETKTTPSAHGPAGAENTANTKAEEAAIINSWLEIQPPIPLKIAVVKLADQLLLITDHPLNPSAIKITEKGKEIFGAPHLWPQKNSETDVISLEIRNVSSNIPVKLSQKDANTKHQPSIIDKMVVWQQGFAWMIGENSKAIASNIAHRMLEHEGKTVLGAHMPSEDIKPLDVVDPILGNRLLVLPVASSGLRNQESRDMQQVSVLPTLQGLVWQLKTDHIKVDVQNHYLLLLPKEGLLTASHPLGSIFSGRKNSNLLKLGDWQTNHYPELQKRRQELERQASKSEIPAESINQFINLARLHLAFGYSNEADAYLNLTIRHNPASMNALEMQGLKGASLALMHKGEEARKLLSNSAMDEFDDIALWRALAHIQQKQWDKVSPDLEKAVATFKDSSKPLQEAIFSSLLQAAIQLKDSKIAEEVLETIEHIEKPAENEKKTKDDKTEQSAYLRMATKPALHYFKALLAEIKNEDPEKNLKSVMASHDPYFKVIAEAKLLPLLIKNKKITPELAIERYQSLIYAWRGDELEEKMVFDMGVAQLQMGKYRDGFASIGNVKNRFPQSTLLLAADKAVSDSFQQLFIEGGADKLPIVEAAALFKDFNSLLPEGVGRTKAVEKLSNRMADVELLDQAANLLAEQFKKETDLVVKNRLALRAAGLSLLNGKADIALSMLDSINQETADDPTKQEIKLLRADAFSRLARVDKALEQLEGLSGNDVERLRADIGWRSKRWNVVATALARLAGPIPPNGIKGEQARLILNQAVAISLSGDKEGLNGLRTLYSGKFAEKNDMDTFNLITRPNGDEGLSSLANLRAQVSEIDTFKGVLEKYRNGSSS